MADKERIKKIILIGIIITVIIGIAVSIGILIWVVQATPDISDYGNWEPVEGTVVYAANGDVLTKFYEENRIYVSLEQIPENLQQAVIAIEDTRFRKHFGIDPIGILRALWIDLKYMAKVQGASTITQQLARNALLTSEKSFARKLKEIYLALQFERMYTKDEILEFYLNEIFMGHSIYGMQSAANFYFNKNIEDLTLSECALLAGLIRGPNYYSPYRNKEEAKERRNLVLDRMVELEYISSQEARQAKQAPIKLEQSEEEKKKKTVSYFLGYVRKKLLDKFGAKRLYTEGLEVYTTLEPKIQEKAYQVITKAIESGYIPTAEAEAGYGQKQPQIALVTIDPETGYIKAMIGGRGNDKFNRATQAYRQVGSAFKPFVYTAAVKQGMSPGTVIDDSLKEYKVSSKGDKTWIPKNYNGKYLGPTTFRIGLAKSINVMAVKLLDRVGGENVIKLGQKLGLENLGKEDRNLAIALGGLTEGATPFDMAEAYSVYANQGIKVPPLAITKVYDRFGNLIWDNAAKKETQKEIILEEEVSYLITDMLKSSLARWGTGWRANIGRPAAGKTGTTSNYTDAWFIGYTPDLVTSIWIGEDQPRKMEYSSPDEKGKTRIITSGQAAKLWGDYMSLVVEDRPVKYFDRPDEIVAKKICIESGKSPNQYCRSEGTVREELFIAGTEPTEVCKLHKKTEEIKVDTVEWKTATNFCPESNVEIKRYQVETGIIVDDKGVPVKRYKEENNLKIPVRNKQGQFVYKEVPQEKCSKHMQHNILKNKIIDTFNFNNPEKFNVE